jgi:hypothetical protein
MNVAALSRVGDGERIGIADGQRLFHHDVYSVARAGFNHSAMIVWGGVNQRGLRVRLSQHVVEAGVVELGIETNCFAYLAKSAWLGSEIPTISMSVR